MGACPMMGNILATTTEEKWTYEQLMMNTVCQFCNRNHYNNWYSCNRRSCMVNLHKGLINIRRQHWYLVKLVAKYAINPFEAIKIAFSGHPGAKTEQQTYRISHISLPKDLQTRTFITHGKNKTVIL